VPLAPAVKARSMLPPLVLVRVKPLPLDAAVTPVSADTLLIAETAAETLFATLPVLVTEIAMPLTVMVSTLPPIPVKEPVPAADTFAFTVAVRPETPALLIAATAWDASFVTVHRLNVPVPGPEPPTTMVEAPVAPRATLLAAAPVYPPRAPARALATEL